MPALLLTPLARLAIYALLIVAVIVTAFVKGMNYEQMRQEVAERDQAVATITLVKKQVENTVRVVTKYKTIQAAAQVVTQTVEKEVVKYVEAIHPDCFIANEFEWVWDDISRMRGADADGVRASTDPTSRTDGGHDSGLTTAEILSAHAADAQAYYELRDKYQALVEWIKTSYMIQQKGAGR